MIIGPAFPFRKKFLRAKKKDENEFGPADGNSESSEN